MALALHKTDEIQQKIKFAQHALRGYNADIEWSARHKLCCALTQVGDPKAALRYTKGDEIIVFRIAELHANNDNTARLQELAELAYAAAEYCITDAHDANEAISTMLAFGRRDLAMSIFEDFFDDKAEYLACSFFKALTTPGREFETLRLSRDVRLHSSRAAALVGWASATCWPESVRSRNLQILARIATNVV